MYSSCGRNSRISCWLKGCTAVPAQNYAILWPRHTFTQIEFLLGTAKLLIRPGYVPHIRPYCSPTVLPQPEPIKFKKPRKRLKLAEVINVSSDNTYESCHKIVKLHRRDIREEVANQSKSGVAASITKVVESPHITAKPTCERETEDAKEKEVAGKEEENATGTDVKRKAKAIADKYKEVRRHSKMVNYNKLLTSTLGVCMNVGLKMEAVSMFMANKDASWVGIEPYNVILRGLSNRNLLEEMIPVIDGLKTHPTIVPDEDTFSAILSCLGQNEVSSFKNRIEEILLWMQQKNINISNVVNGGNDNREFILRAVEEVVPGGREMCDRDDDLKTKFESWKYNNPLVDRLNESLSGCPEESPVKGLLSEEDLDLLLEKQLENEVIGHVKIKNIFTVSRSSEVEKYRKLLEQWEEQWRKSLKEAILAQREVYKEKLDSDISQQNRSNLKVMRVSLYPYLMVLDVDDMVDLLISEVANLGMGSEWFSLPRHTLSVKLSHQMFEMYSIKCQTETGDLKRLKDAYKAYFRWYVTRDDPGQSYVHRIQWQRLLYKLGSHKSYLKSSSTEWPYEVKKSLGNLLFSLIVQHVHIATTVDGKTFQLPALYKVSRQYSHASSSGEIRYEIKPAPALAEAFLKSAPSEIKFPSNSLPMLTPTSPWTSPYLGGYLLCKSALVRPMPFDYQHRKALLESDDRQLFPIIDSLNQLGAVPWKVNTELLDLVIAIFNTEGWPDMEIPSFKKATNAVNGIANCSSYVDKRQELKDLESKQKEKNEHYSLWCSALYKLSIANHYRNAITWLPTNLDFRGRTYPIPPHMTHITSDLFRSLMMFAQGRPLGHTGLKWLKIHLVNLTGFKKRCSIRERLQYCDEILEDILDSADHPLNGKKWWVTTDEPWQCLAACKELAAALRSPNPEEFVSHLPIHQDGSCNGLQHYAALGRDEAGARSVNLAPGEVPQDVYSDVVALVEERRKKDAANGNPLAQLLDGYVGRKVIKQTVMTTVYGVTRFGAKLQIAKQLKAFDSFPKEKIYPASMYLSSKVFESLGSMFSATNEIQDWFVRCSETITKVCYQNVDWVTPLGFPVVQPYSSLLKEKHLPKNYYFNFNLHLDFFGHFLKPLYMKQKNAFPPNFIHSLDSSHMMLTSLYCQQAGIAFVSIHDCFWTHACTVGIMNKICREQFVALHSQPILNDMSRHFVDKFGTKATEVLTIRKKSSRSKSKKRGKFIVDEEEDVVGNEQHEDTEVLEESFQDPLTTFQDVPRLGSFDINRVKDSTFFFS